MHDKIPSTQRSQLPLKPRPTYTQSDAARPPTQHPHSIDMHMQPRPFSCRYQSNRNPPIHCMLAAFVRSDRWPRKMVAPHGTRTQPCSVLWTRRPRPSWVTSTWTCIRARESTAMPPALACSRLPLLKAGASYPWLRSSAISPSPPRKRHRSCSTARWRRFSTSLGMACTSCAARPPWQNLQVLLWNVTLSKHRLRSGIGFACA